MKLNRSDQVTLINLLKKQKDETGLAVKEHKLLEKLIRNFNS